MNTCCKQVLQRVQDRLGKNADALIALAKTLGDTPMGRACEARAETVVECMTILKDEAQK